MLVLLLVGQLAALPSAPDSARVLRDARAAQSAFERERRRLLPITTAGTGRCDVRIGRFCYWYDEREPPPPPEPPKIALLRDRLLMRLELLAARSPSESWIAGQRVRYLVEAGRPDEALAVARGCGAGWRCSAMAGFAAHAGRHYLAADSAFAGALATMPEAQRCRWTDLGSLLETPGRGPYRQLDCPPRDSANASLPWLLTPLHAGGGRDLRTEILARHALAGILEGAVTHHGLSAGADYTEMLLRYGWATAYGRRHDPLGRSEQVDVVGHEPKPSYPFLAWTPGKRLAQPDRPRFRYAPPYLRQLAELRQVQVARFRRGDSLLVAVAYAVEGDSLFRPDAARGWVFVSSDGGASVVSMPIHGRAASALVAAPPGSAIVSVELGDTAAGAWRRYRDSVARQRNVISDLLVFRADTLLPQTLEEAAARALGRLEFGAGEPVGLYWETYPEGLDRLPGPFRLTVTPASAGFLRRVGRAVGAGGGRSSIELEWTPGAGSGGEPGHSLELDLSRLSPGRYLIRLSAGGPGAAREIHLK